MCWRRNQRLCSHLPVRGDEFEGLGHLMSCGSSSYIQEVGRRAAMELDDVHGGHCQTSAVYWKRDTLIIPETEAETRASCV